MQNCVISTLEHLGNKLTPFPWERVQQKAFMDQYLRPPGWERTFWSFKLFWTRFLTFHLYLFHRQTTQTPWFVVYNTVSQHCHSHCLSGLKIWSARLDLVMQEHHNWDIFKRMWESDKTFTRAQNGTCNIFFWYGAQHSVDSDTRCVSVRMSLDGTLNCLQDMLREHSERWNMLTVSEEAHSGFSTRASQIHNSLSLYQLPRKDGGESILQITVIHLYPESGWCRASASAGPAEDGFHVDPRDLSQAPSEGNYLEHAEHLTRFAMIYVALCTGNIIRDTCIGLLLINFTLILPLDTFQYNMDNPDDWKLIA